LCIQKTYFYHWVARGICLIFIPFCVYVASFKAHFMILNRSGPGDAQMSSLFQAHLRGNDFAESPLGRWDGIRELHRSLLTNFLLGEIE
jgi:dolichyl-phosphate-mannose-protein mannosyltransferase